jgi:hypothetical protein
MVHARLERIRLALRSPSSMSSNPGFLNRGVCFRQAPQREPELIRLLHVLHFRLAPRGIVDDLQGAACGQVAPALGLGDVGRAVVREPLADDGGVEVGMV